MFGNSDVCDVGKLLSFVHPLKIIHALPQKICLSICQWVSSYNAEKRDMKKRFKRKKKQRLLPSCWAAIFFNLHPWFKCKSDLDVKWHGLCQYYKHWNTGQHCSQKVGLGDCRKLGLRILNTQETVIGWIMHPFPPPLHLKIPMLKQ